MMTIKRFVFEKDEPDWNNFIKVSKNTTFLFNRGFMDYHSQRFNDYSLMVYDLKDKLICCFPANLKDSDKIVSHSGLTYGGFIIKRDIKLSVLLEVYKSILNYYSTNGISKIVYKAFPRIYNSIPSDEIDYALFLTKAKLIRRDTALVINRANKIKYSGNIRREAAAALKIGITVLESQKFDDFWDNVLAPNLQQRFGVEPVHSKDEILLLKERFPDNIKLFTAHDKNGNVVSGTVFFLKENVAHCQYIAASDEGRRSGALNLLFISLIDNNLNKFDYFDFGIVNENNGLEINQGMLSWKERMGGRTVSHDFYEIETSNWNLIK